MAVIGFNLKKILVERKSLVRGDVKVSTKTKITDVKEESRKIAAGKDSLSFDFEFSIKYFGVGDHKGDLADVVFQGSVLCLIDPKDTKKIMEGWKKQEVPMDLKLSILNTILSKCTVRALDLEEELGLPPHTPLPKFKETTDKK